MFITKNIRCSHNLLIFNLLSNYYLILFKNTFKN
nr:MAG TPA: hypothetical protein [Herelleviridae sp.]